MPALWIDAVDVLEDAALLDDEGGGARLEEVMDFLRRELREGSEAPLHHFATAFAEAAFARCNHVSTTVSGLSDIDSIPSAISHSARSG